MSELGQKKLGQKIVGQRIVGQKIWPKNCGRKNCGRKNYGVNILISTGKIRLEISKIILQGSKMYFAFTVASCSFLWGLLSKCLNQAQFCVRNFAKIFKLG
jgi:hypothetical protein